MISKLKYALLPLYSKLGRAYLRFYKGVELSNSCTIWGLPRILKKKGSRIILHPSTTLISYDRFNPIVSKKIKLITFSSRAVIEIGDGAGISGSHIACCEKISIGAKTIIGADCLIFDWKAHDYDPDTAWVCRKGIRGAPINIGKNCYIGTRCTILKGVTIGDNCVVSAGTIVNKDIPAGHLASGNPMTFTPLPERLGGPREEA